MTDDQIFLASAYLDGELSDAERGIAEADPVVLAEVERLRAIQASMASVEPPSNEARESAISAALAAFQPAGAAAENVLAPPPPPGNLTTAESTVVPIARKRPVMAWLSVAAAAVAIGLFGVLVARSGSTDDSSADSATAGTIAEAEAGAADAETEGGITEQYVDEAVNTDAPAEERTAAAPAAEDMTEAGEASDDVATDAETAPEESTPTNVATADTNPAAEMSEPATLTLDQAVDLAESLLAEPAVLRARQIETSENQAVEACVSGEVDSTIDWSDLNLLVVFDFIDIDAETAPVPAVLVVDSLDAEAALNTVSVIDLTTCEIIEQAPLR